MKKHYTILLVLTLTLYAFSAQAQKQIGADIDGEAAGDVSGGSVSLSADGTVVAIGATGNKGTGNNQAGHVRIYKYNTTTGTTGTGTTTKKWTQLGQDIDGEADKDNSGFSVSLSDDGTIVAIGALRNGGTDKRHAGHVRVYQYNGTTKKWTQLGQDIDGEAAGDWSGSSVSLSADGKTVAIGAPRNAGTGEKAGHVRVYQYTAATGTGSSTTKKWTQIGKDIDGEAAGDQAGESVSLSADGKTVAIGAPRNAGTGAKAGHVRVYQYSTASGGTTKKWTQLGKDIDGEAVNDESGWSVSLSADGKTVAIGAPRNSGSGFFAGHVRVYQYNTAAGTTGTGSTTKKWTQIGQDLDGEAAVNESGRSVSLSADGKTVAIGAPQNAGKGLWAGHARIYRYNAATTKKWTQLGKDIDGETLLNQSGKSVSLSDDGLTVAIGAPLNGEAKGHVRVYDIPPVITSAATVSVPENTTNFTYTITANEEVTFALGTGGGDEALFKLSEAKVSFKVATASGGTGPDFETPKDADKDNVYKLELKATDAAKNTSTLLLSIKVTNVDGVISLPASLAFDDTKVGETAVKDLTISNTGDAALTVTKVTYPAGFTGDWSNGAIAVGGKKVVKVSFKPTEVKDYAGTITVESNATNANAGKNTLSVSGKGVLVTGIDPQTVFPGLNVFPNPAADVLNIKLPKQTSPVDIQLVDVNGQVAYERKAVTGDALSIDVSGYKSGVYVLVVQTRAAGGSKVVEWRVVIN